MVDELAAIWAADLERHALDCRPAVGRRSIPGDCPVHVALDLPGRSGLTHAGYKWDRLKEYRGKANLTLQHRAKGLDLQGGQLQPFMTNTAITRRKSCGICSLIPEDCAGWEDEVLRGNSAGRRTLPATIGRLDERSTLRTNREAVPRRLAVFKAGEEDRKTRW